MSNVKFINELLPKEYRINRSIILRKDQKKMKCEKSRAEAFDMMVEHAQQIGANALVGVRYDTTELMSGVTEVLCYGTAVVLEKLV
jgi:uncharacterized protein YbjQ (UPF0145 family)